VIFGETIAIDYCRIMATFAPYEDARSFLLQQQNEEDLHLELLTRYVGGHARPKVGISKPLRKLDAIMSDAITRRDYIDCIFIQNFIVEGLNISLLRELEHHADGELSELCTRILADEVGHMEFGVTELQRILREDTTGVITKRLVWLQRKTLWYATGLAMTLARESSDLGIPMHELSEKTVNDHFERITRAGFPLPPLDRLLFNFVRLFLKLL
jgi:fatty aldehyde decarbonylase